AGRNARVQVGCRRRGPYAGQVPVRVIVARVFVNRADRRRAQRRHEALGDVILVVLREAHAALEFELVGDLIAERTEGRRTDVELLLARIAVLDAAGERVVVEAVDRDVLVEVIHADDLFSRT